MFIKRASKCRLIFVTGKGGVGKSAVSAALAGTLASRGRRVALVELSSEYTLCRFLATPPSNSHMDDISPHLCLFRFQPDDILEDFVDEKFHFRGVYKILFDNRFVKYFLDATPGFHEFLIMSRLWHLAEHNLTPFDTIIVDAPATGHALALFEVPKIVTEAVHSGPLRQAASRSLDLITNNTKTGIIIVSIAEEMSATEAGIIKAKSKKMGLNTIGVVINRIDDGLPTSVPVKKIPKEHSVTIKNIMDYNIKIAANQKKHIGTLKKIFGKNIIYLPTINGADDPAIASNFEGFFNEY